MPEGNKKIGLMKYLTAKVMAIRTEFVALKPKLYSFLVEVDEEIREKPRAKGVKIFMIKKSLRHANLVNNYFMTYENQI